MYSSSPSRAVVTVSGPFSNERLAPRRQRRRLVVRQCWHGVVAPFTADRAHIGASPIEQGLTDDTCFQIIVDFGTNRSTSLSSIFIVYVATMVIRPYIIHQQLIA